MNCQRVDRVGCFHAIFLCCLCLAMVKSEHSSIMLSMTQVSLLRAGWLSHTLNYAAQMGVFSRTISGHFSETIIISSLSHFRIRFFGTFPFCNGKPINFTLICPIWKCLNTSPPTPYHYVSPGRLPCKFMSRSILSIAFWIFCCCPNIDYWGIWMVSWNYRGAWHLNGHKVLKGTFWTLSPQ